MSLLRMAIVGAGHLGRIHARLAQDVDGVELVFIVDPDQQACRHVAKESKAQPLASHHELAGRVDVAVVATPTRLHHAIGRDLLESGIHILIEKPLATTLREADELVATARANRRVLQVGHVERFNPAYEAARPYVQRPKYIEAVRTSSYSFRSTDIGAVLDLMSHDLDLVMDMVRGRLLDVQALGISVLGQHEDMAQARLSFEGGCVANLSVSRTSFQAQRVMHVYSEQGYVGMDFSAGTARCLCPSREILQRRVGLKDLAALSENDREDTLQHTMLPLQQLEVTPQNALLEELRDLVGSIRAGRSPRVNGTHGRTVLAAAEQVLKRIQSHRWDGTADGPVGPLAVPGTHVLRRPHWLDGATLPRENRRAG